MKLHKVQAAAVWLLLTVCLVSGADISCTSPGTVVKGKSASLTCHYNQDLQSQKQDFYIYRHNSGEDAVIVAICAWEDSSLTCDFQPGYQATVQGRNVTLSIAHVDAEHAGNYSCTTLPPRDGDETEDCVLSVKGEVKHSSAKVTCFTPAHLHKDHPVSVTCIFPDSLGADTVSLQRHERTYSNKPVELVRCNSEGSCEVKENGCPVETEHSPKDGFRLITAKVQQAGQYLCKATKRGRQDEICLAKVETVAEQTDNSLHMLTTPIYVILAVLVLAVLLCVGAAILFARRSNWCKKPNTVDELQSSKEPLRG